MNIPSDQPEVPRAFKNDLEMQYASLRRLLQATAVGVLFLNRTVLVFF
jgi:hypothetical protein